MKTQLKQKTQSIKLFFRNLSKKMIVTIVCTLTAMGTIWLYAAFTEPTVGPIDSDQDFAQNILGANNSDNDFNSNEVVANNDGSLVERLESIKNYIDTEISAINAEVTNLDGSAMRGTDSAETEASALTRYNNIYGKIDTEIASILVDTGTTLDNFIDDLETRMGTNSDSASLSGTLFGGQQYIWDNRASFKADDATPGGWTCTVRTASTSGNNSLSATALCLSSEKLITGGCSASLVYNDDYEQYPTDQGYYCYHSTTSDGWTIYAYANCCE